MNDTNGRRCQPEQDLPMMRDLQYIADPALPTVIRSYDTDPRLTIYYDQGRSYGVYGPVPSKPFAKKKRV